MTTDIATAVSATLESLPSPPAVALEIIRLTNDPESSAGDLGNVLQRDPVLATRIVQVANSPAYGLAHEVSGVERATAMLGLKAVKMMALSFSLASDIGEETGALAVEMYWYHSLLNAVAARRWAELESPGLTEEAFLAGLLSHLGRLVLAQERPAAFTQVLDTSGPWPAQSAEAEVFGFSSADLTVVLLREWGLPQIITAGLASMFTDVEPDEEVNGAVELASILRKTAVTEQVLTTSDPEALEELSSVAGGGLVETHLDDFVVDLEVRVRSMAEMLEVGIPQGTSHQKLLDDARARLVAVSLEAAQNLQSAEQQAEELRVSNAELEDKAFVDRLTQVPNRAAFDDHLARSIAHAVRRDGGAVGLLLFDIDHFKQFNDTYGHQLGDEVLRVCAQAMSSVSRSDELFARYGGEEFALVATDCTPHDLFVTGERLRKAVEAVQVPSESGTLSVTISAGAAVLGDLFDREAAVRLIKLADEALYAAKEAGRNRVQVVQ